MLRQTVFFPIGAAGAAEVSMPVLCAATSASAFALQEGDAHYIRSVYQHLGIEPEHYGEALRQMGLAWSASRWFAEPCDLRDAVRPTGAMIASAENALARIAERQGGATFHASFAAFFQNGSYAAAVEGGLTAGIGYLEESAYLSFRAGDIEASLTLMNDVWEALPEVVDRVPAASHVRFAELWARMGSVQRAREHIALAGSRAFGAAEQDFPGRYCERMCIESRSSLRAAIAAEALTRDGSVSRFLAHIGIARGMFARAKPAQAEAYLLNLCLPAAKRVEDRLLRETLFMMLRNELAKHGMEESVQTVMDANLNSSDDADRA